MGHEGNSYFEDTLASSIVEDLFEFHTDNFDLVSTPGHHLHAGFPQFLYSSTSMEWAEASMQNLTTLVQDILKSNINLAARMRNLERVNPASARSVTPAPGDVRNRKASKSRVSSRMTYPSFAFEAELATSTVYQRVAAHSGGFSKSSNSSNGPSYLSGLSLSDISNVSAIALPILSMELWNHHRYSCLAPDLSTIATTSLEAWYNLPAKVRSFLSEP